jgi:hypothetical protein
MYIPMAILFSNHIYDLALDLVIPNLQLTDAFLLHGTHGFSVKDYHLDLARR